MKTFKFIVMALLAIMMGMNLASCSSDNDVITTDSETVTGAPKEYTISIGWKGEIVDITESPLATRATENNDLYCIQVYSSPKKEWYNQEYTQYAFGLFDDVGKMTIKLLEGYKFKFVATMVVDGKNRLNSWDNYSSQFNTYLTNAFKYSSVQYLSNLGSGNGRPQQDRYYGELENYQPSENGVANIKMTRTSFGVKVIAAEMTKGKLTIKIERSIDMNIVFPDTETQELLSLENCKQAWREEFGINADTGEHYPINKTYSESIPISFTWTKDDGVELPLGTQTIEFKRNKLTTISIKVADKSIGGDIGITYEEKGDMRDGGTVEINPGSSSDNNVDPKP